MSDPAFRDGFKYEKNDHTGITFFLGNSKNAITIPNNNNISNIEKNDDNKLIDNTTSNKINWTEKYSKEEVEAWLFNGQKNKNFPSSKLGPREQEKYAPKKLFDDVNMIGDGKYTSRMGIHSGGITDLKVSEGQTAAVGDSNNGDLLTGCGYAVAKAVVNAAGPSLQAELYNRFGVPGIMDQPQYGKENYGHTEGRGYAISCNSYDMLQTHGINQVELLTVPMYNLDGLKNMYREALNHSKDLDYIALPMAGMSHPLLEGKPELSAQIATEAVKEFIDNNPTSKLKVIFTIFNDQNSENSYKKHANKL